MTEKQAQIMINLGNGKEALLLRDNLDQYVRLTGMSKKQFYLRGAAMMIGSENSHLVMQIAEHLAGVRQGRPPSVTKGAQ